jgi:hypothetical protein
MRTIVKERYNITNSVTNELIEYQYGIKFVEENSEFLVDISPNDIPRGDDIFLVTIQDYIKANNKEWITVEEFEQLKDLNWTDVTVLRTPHVHGDQEQEDYTS